MCRRIELVSRSIGNSDQPAVERNSRRVTGVRRAPAYFRQDAIAAREKRVESSEPARVEFCVRVDRAESDWSRADAVGTQRQRSVRIIREIVEREVAGQRFDSLPRRRKLATFERSPDRHVSRTTAHFSGNSYRTV